MSEEQLASQGRRSLLNGGLPELCYGNYDCTLCMVVFSGLVAQCNFLTLKFKKKKRAKCT